MMGAGLSNQHASGGEYEPKGVNGEAFRIATPRTAEARVRYASSRLGASRATLWHC
jgi:hypothetical protein